MKKIMNQFLLVLSCSTIWVCESSAATVFCENQSRAEAMRFVIEGYLLANLPLKGVRFGTAGVSEKIPATSEDAKLTNVVMVTIESEAGDTHEQVLVDAQDTYDSGCLISSPRFDKP